MTPMGEGELSSFRTEKRWIGQRPYSTAWIVVKLTDGSRREFAAADVKPIGEEI